MPEQEANQPTDPRKALPKAKDRDPVLRQTNLAKDNDELCKAVLKKIAFYMEKFRRQTARTDLESKLKRVDEIILMVAGQTKDESNRTLDETDHRPENFFDLWRTACSHECNILAPLTGQIAEYQPPSNCDSATKQMAAATCKKRNAQLEYSVEADDRITKIRNMVRAVNKDTCGWIGMEWLDQKVSRRERQPVAFDPETKEPTKWAWKTVTHDESHPVMLSWGADEVYADATIDGAQQQQCIVLDWKPEYGDLVRGLKKGQFANVDKVTAAHLYRGNKDNNVKNDRQTSARGGTDETQPSGLYDGKTAWIKIPVDADGNWDEATTIPAWHLVSFVGDAADATAVVLRIIPNPHTPYSGEGDIIPLEPVRSHWYNNGLYHPGFVDFGERAWIDLKTAYDQYYEAKNIQMAAPMKVGQGAIISKAKAFTGLSRTMLEMEMGRFGECELLKCDVQTQDMPVIIQDRQQGLRNVFAITKAWEGEEMGSRTSASEATRAFQQSARPSLDKMEYMEQQINVFLARWDAAMWRQFASAEREITVTRDREVITVKPAQLYGDYCVKIGVVANYEKDTMRRLEEDKFNQVMLPFLAPSVGRKRTAMYLRDVYEMRGWSPDRCDKIFGYDSDGDARNVAQMEDQMLLSGLQPMPAEGEDHEVHLDDHNNTLALYSTLPTADAAAVARLKMHIQATEAMLKAQQTQMSAGAAMAQQTPQAPGLGAAGETPQTPGGVAQNLMGALGGEMGG